MKKEQKIDLKKRALSRNKQNPEGWISLTTHTLSDDTLDELASIAQMLDKVGVSLELTRNENDSIGMDYDFLVLKINKEKYNRVMTRGAGRKADFNKKYDKYGKCTVAELQEKLRTMPKTKIAEELKCPRMTLYRIIKNINRMEPKNTMSIWHFTS